MSMKILIVDDNPDDRKILHQYLNHFGAEILEATDGAQGFATALREKPDLIISDVLMPNVDGFGFLRELRRTKELSQTLFVFYTSVYTGARDEELAFSLGVDAYIAKPMEATELLSQLKTLLERQDKSAKRPESTLLEEEEIYLRKYSQVVAAQLELKVRALEEANNKLAANEARYRNLFNSMRDVIIVADSERIILDVNQPALRETFGYEMGEVLGKRTDFLFSSLEAFTTAGKEIFNGIDPDQQKKILEIEYRRKNGDLFSGELLGQKWIDDNGQPIGNIGVIRDVTEKHKLEEQLRQSQKMESIGTFAGGISHDFNNILAAIIGYGALILRKMQVDDPQRLKMEHLLEAADRAVHLTRDLLLFSRKQSVDKKVVDLNQIVTKGEKFLARIIGENIELKTDLEQTPLPIMADGHQLDQVLLNLAANARDAMQHGGRLTLTTEAVVLSKGSAEAKGLKIAGSYVRLTVSDTGAGISQETQQRMFEPFYTTKAVGQGTGLGLPVVYGIIEEHLGQIMVQSAPGQGTSISIYLPQTSNQTPVLQTEEQVQPLIGGTETILLAEDDESVREMTHTILQEAGYKVIIAIDGKDAVQKFKTKQEAIDLLLFDLVMPIMNGKEAYTEIMKRCPEVKVLFVSGYAPDLIRPKMEGENQIVILSKPVTPEVLLQTVRNILDASCA